MEKVMGLRRKPLPKPKGYPSKKAEKAPRNKSGYKKTVNFKKKVM